MKKGNFVERDITTQQDIERILKAYGDLSEEDVKKIEQAAYLQSLTNANNGANDK